MGEANTGTPAGIWVLWPVLRGLDEPRRSWIGSFVSSVLTGSSAPKNAKLYVAFADGSRYERMPLPWVRELDWPKIVGRSVGLTRPHLASEG